MGSIYHSSYSIPLPSNAAVKGNTVAWKDKRGRAKTGKLTTSRDGSKKVTVETDNWIAKYTDENGQIRTVATGCKTREMAERFLSNLETEVERIRAGVITRKEIETSKPLAPLEECLNAFETHLKAKGTTAKHINDTRSKVNTITQESGITTLDEINRDRVEQWIVQQRTNTTQRTNHKGKKATLAPRTINAYMTALTSFMGWCVETGRLPPGSGFKVKKLNENVDKRIVRRALSDQEIHDLLKHSPPNANFFTECYLGPAFE